MMKKFCRVFFLLIFPIAAIAQSDTVKINSIKKQFTEINNNIASYKKIIKQDTVKTTEGNEVTAWLDGTDIKKIIAIYYGETGQSINEFYFTERRLIFYYSQLIHYKLPINGGLPGAGKIGSIDKERYYFDKDLLIRHTSKPVKKLSVNEVRKEAKRLKYFMMSKNTIL